MARILSDDYTDLYEKYKSQLEMLSGVWEEEETDHCEEYETLTLEEKVLVDKDMECLKKRGVGTYMSNNEIEHVLSILVKRNREECGNKENQ